MMKNGNSVSFTEFPSISHLACLIQRVISAQFVGRFTTAIGLPNTNSNHSVSNELSYLNNSRNRSTAYLTKIKQPFKS